MLWGLTFSKNPMNIYSNLNKDLEERMKSTIRSNSGIAIQHHPEKIIKENVGMNIDVGLLTFVKLPSFSGGE